MRFKTSKDTDISVIFSTDDSVLEKYQKHGPKVIERIESEFSFALYDKNNDLYFAARDPLGVKALYYTKHYDNYYFSPDISRLFELSSLEKRPNLKSMRTMLECQSVDHSETMFEGVYRLPPGYTLTIKNGKANLERYWFPEKIETDYRIGIVEAAARIEALLEKAVRIRIDNLEETAFELSGGLDSSSVVSLMVKRGNARNISSYAMGFGGMDCDEGEYIDAMLQKYALNHKMISVTNLDYRNTYSLENLYRLSPDWPITITFAMSIPMIKQMAKDGKKVIISGQGGDHLFTGTPAMMATLLRRGRIGTLLQELKHYRYPFRALKSYALRPILPENALRLYRRYRGQKPKKPSKKSECDWMSTEYANGIRDEAKKMDLDMVTWALHTTLMDGNLFHCMEREFGLEYRHPFFDRELVEFALSLPPHMKFREKKIKWILRKAMEGILPEKIRKRPDKAEFSEVLMQQIDAVDLDALLNDPHIVRLGLIERETLDEYIESYEKRQKKHTVPFWCAINVEYWYRYNGFGCK